MSDRALGMLGIATGLAGLGVQIVFPNVYVGWLCILMGCGLAAYAFFHERRSSNQAGSDPPALPLPTERLLLPTTANRTTADVTPDYLVGLFRGLTSIQAGQIARAYIGRWMTVSGILGDVMDFETFVQVTFRQSSPTVYMYFTDYRRDLATLRPGEQIQVTGRIKDVDRATVHLELCELVAK